MLYISNSIYVHSLKELNMNKSRLHNLIEYFGLEVERITLPLYKLEDIEILYFEMIFTLLSLPQLKEFGDKQMIIHGGGSLITIYFSEIEDIFFKIEKGQINDDIVLNIMLYQRIHPENSDSEFKHLRNFSRRLSIKYNFLDDNNNLPLEIDKYLKCKLKEVHCME